MNIEFIVKNQLISRTDNNKVIGDSKNYLKAVFTFATNEWTGTKTAIFKSGSVVKHQLLDDDDSCYVPWEVIKKYAFSVSVFCGDLITANSASVGVDASGYEEGGRPEDPTTDIYNQIIELIKTIADKGATPEQLERAVSDYFEEHPIESITEEECQVIVASYVNAHKSELKGDKGDQGIQGPKGDKGEDITSIDDSTTSASKTYSSQKISSLLGGKQNTLTEGANISISGNTISAEVPTKTSELTNDSGFITESYHDATKQNTLVAGSNITIEGNTISASGGGSDLDVQINGTSIVSEGVANIPLAEAGTTVELSKIGMVYYDSNSFTLPTSGLAKGLLSIQDVNESSISNRYFNRPITAKTLDYAVKSALCDGKGASWSDAEKLKARERLGLGGDFELIEEITLEEETDNFTRSVEPNGTPYRFKNIIIYCEIPAGNTQSSVTLKINTYWVGYVIRPVNDSSKTFFAFYGEVKNGRLFTENSSQGQPQADSSIQLSIRNHGSLGKYEMPNGITRLDLINCTFPIGSKITIHGVR